MAQTVKNLPAMQETQARSLGQEDPLEKGKATYSSILAWRISIVHRVTICIVHRTRLSNFHFMGFPCGSAGKESTCNAADLGSIPGLGRSPGEGKGYLLQYSGLENSTDREAWHATLQGLQSPMQLTNFHFHFSVIEIRKNLFP